MGGGVLWRVSQVTVGISNEPSPSTDVAVEAHGLPEPPSRQSVGFIYARSQHRKHYDGRTADHAEY